MLEIYTDGACRNNGQPNAKGGWGFFIPSLEMGYSGGESGTTNNRMEMMACVQAMKTCVTQGLSNVKILTDSKYVVDGLTSWMQGWKRNGNFKEGLKNYDLWKELDELFSTLKPQIQWVRGHNGTAGNERADELSVYGIDNPATQEHAGVREHSPFGKADKVKNSERRPAQDSPDSREVLHPEEDLTSLFDDFELNGDQPADFDRACSFDWEREVIDLITPLSKLSYEQFSIKPKKALESLKLLNSLAKTAQELIYAEAQPDTKSLKKAQTTLRKTLARVKAYLDKPTTKKLLSV